ncbi:DUF1254 domain-containing protein [Nocardia sp. NBC_00416]|uniref:DUF1254 domain-containing protein n=1 Tax=Nocardia sp. NBC_00416 TaxID=2975991 RepID=UPI002E217708
MDTREELAYVAGVQALTWGYPLICYAATNEASVSAGAAYVNEFRLFDQLKTAADRYVVTPNNVTLDGYANLDLTEEPVVLHVPVLTDSRWYIVQIGDMFDEVIADIGGTKGPQPGGYALCGPDFHGDLPAGIIPIRLRTRTAVAALRVFVDGDADTAAAGAAQRGFRLLPLSAFRARGLGYRGPDGGMAPKLAATTDETLRLFDQLGQAMQWYLPTSGDRDEPLIASFRHIGLTVAAGFEPATLDEAIVRGLKRAAPAAEAIIDACWERVGETVNGWRYYFAGGRAGHDFTLRSALVKYVLGAQLAEEVLYPPCSVDAAGRPLHGSNDYTLRFPAGQAPPVSVFWNLALYGDDMLFVANSRHRYSIGSTTDGLHTDPDGALTLYIQHDRPADPDAAANWLPAPADAFNLTMRMYGPDATVLDGTYRLPAVTRAH